MSSMILKKRVFFTLLGAIVFLTIGCEKLDKLNLPYLYKKKAFQPQGTVIAKVGDLVITLEQLEQEIKNYNELTDNPASKLVSREQKIAYLNEELVKRYLLYSEAKDKKIDSLPKNQELLRNLEINVLANQLLQDEVGNITVTSSEVEDFYSLYKDQYQQVEERRVREIVLDDETAAKDILIELLKGADFATLAKERSKAPSAASGGDLGFIRKGQRGADFSRFDTVAFSSSLDANQTSNIFKDKNGYYIVKIEEKKGGQSQPITEVWDEIKRNVLFLKQQQKLQEITSGLMKKIKVEIFEDRIK